jgi:Na+-driven multidrug efflux pump
MGKQDHAFIGSLIVFFGIGLPLGLFLGFKAGLQLVGFWMGQLLANFVLITYYTYVISYQFNWKKLSYEMLEKTIYEKLEEDAQFLQEDTQGVMNNS